ncbi:uncharacterized protein V1518DRAFT_406702 [Limtongia smithiae]|uniref:uncharacterized protein n=1 Tax=Limtongia smithiae TaxID=1125753 RepID=UPI0034CEF2B7
MKITFWRAVIVLAALLAHMPQGADARRGGRKNKSNGGHVNGDRVLLSSVSTLVVHSGDMTAHRRVPAVAQLEPVSGDALGLYTVRDMACHNIGFGDGGAEDVRWVCTAANMPEEFRLGTTDVECEGYQSADDPFILRGSCAVRYGIYLTAAGHARYSERNCHYSLFDMVFPIVMLCLFFGLIGLVIFTTTRRRRAKRIAKMDLDVYSTIENQWLDCVDQLPLQGGANDPSDDSEEPPPPYTSINEEAQVKVVHPCDIAREALLPAVEHDQQYSPVKTFDDAAASSSEPTGSSSPPLFPPVATAQSSEWRRVPSHLFFPLLAVYHFLDHLATPSPSEVEHVRWCLRHRRDHPFCVLPAHVTAMEHFARTWESRGTSVVLVDEWNRDHHHSPSSNDPSSSTHSSTGFGGTFRR